MHHKTVHDTPIGKTVMRWLALIIFRFAGWKPAGKKTEHLPIRHHSGTAHLQLGFFLYRLPGVHSRHQALHHDEDRLVPLADGFFSQMVGSHSRPSLQNNPCCGTVDTGLSCTSTNGPGGSSFRNPHESHVLENRLLPYRQGGECPHRVGVSGLPTQGWGYRARRSPDRRYASGYENHSGLFTPTSLVNILTRRSRN